MSTDGEFEGEVLRALAGSNPHHVMTDVKTVVASRLHELDDRVDVTFTNYFNHSYMPDMVLSWKEGGRTKQRPLFVRTDVHEGAIAADIHGLVPQAPMIIAVDKHSSGAPARQALEAEQRERTVDLLMTDTRSISTLFPRQYRSSRTYDFSKLFGGNFLSGGRGFVGEQEATDLYAAAQLTPETASFETFATAVDRYFMEDAALRLKRSTGLVQKVLQGTVNNLDLSGQFTIAEVRAVLPLLLGDERARSTPAIWAQLGEVMSLTDLFEVAHELEGYDIAPLLNANVATWTAKRSQVSLASIDAEGGEVKAGPPAESRWDVTGKFLTLQLAKWRVMFSDDARKLKGRSSDGRVPEWSEIADILPNFPVSRVDLHGIARRVTISAEESNSVYGDIAAVTGALDEVFHVPRVALRSNADQDLNSLVEFSEMLVTASSQDTIANHVKIALNLLLHDKTVNLNELPEDLKPLVVLGEAESA